MQVHPTVWNDATQMGRGRVTVHGKDWEVLDLRDCLAPSTTLRPRLNLDDNEPERRQCTLLAIAAALLWRGADPTLTDVLEVAARYREDLYLRAAEAQTVLADAGPFITPYEAELRMHCHDLLMPY